MSVRVRCLSMYSHGSGWDLTISAKIFPPRMLLWLRGGPIRDINVEKPSTLVRQVVPGISGTFVCLPLRCSYFQLQKRPLSFKNCGTLSVRMYTVCASFRFCPCTFHSRKSTQVIRFPLYAEKVTVLSGYFRELFCFLAIRRKRGRFGAPLNKKISRPAEKSAKRLSRY